MNALFAYFYENDYKYTMILTEFHMGAHSIHGADYDFLGDFTISGTITGKEVKFIK
jgi:hypothetical protein